MQGLSGSFGIVLSVPATVIMAAYIYKMEKKKECLPGMADDSE